MKKSVLAVAIAAAGLTLTACGANNPFANKPPAKTLVGCADAPLIELASKMGQPDTIVAFPCTPQGKKPAKCPPKGCEPAPKPDDKKTTNPPASKPPAPPKAPTPATKPVPMANNGGSSLRIDATGEAATIMARKLTGDSEECCSPTQRYNLVETREPMRVDLPPNPPHQLPAVSPADVGRRQPTPVYRPDSPEPNPSVLPPGTTIPLPPCNGGRTPPPCKKGR
ncbi:MAG: hypothetical protein KBC81_03860 [Candidatus Pacebacteria bacterium]|nr:hypothetical protein [Candidatus Paceibacterota bacterium]